MAVPKKKTPKKATKSRRADHGLEKKNTITCDSCDSETLPHRACSNCGYYKGRKVD
ncbi:MAG: 50S ribosomal protein L32 [Parcubacteria group bacterium QH_9_35_7]|jgi:large subunit ribosomal protein L32|nr:MAG: 50S ribosomal protein L32 [Parcubacteria group bacterium QH_9_35_7]